MEHVERIRGIRVYAIIMEILNENITWKSWTWKGEYY
jgi:hypothetical protein